MHTEHHMVEQISVMEIFGWGSLALALSIGYIYGVLYSNKKFREWPHHRSVCWALGVFCIVFSLVGPIANQAHYSFQAHMYSHLLLGMLGPLFIAFSAPITLLLRILPVNYARLLSKLLKSNYVKIISHPITATILNIGGLWVLYTTNLFQAMHTSTQLYIFVHIHVFLAGFLFTISILNIDPKPHRTSYTIRATLLILAMAGHSILSKWIYGHPPTGVSKVDAEMGGMIMYYGGDAIDVVIVIALCYQYYRKEKPKLKESSVLI